MDSKQGMALPSAHAFVLRTAPKVAALWASIANAFGETVRWAGPFGMATTGVALLMLSVAGSEVKLLTAAFGFVMVLSAFDMRAALAKAAESERWAKLVAGMISNETQTTITVNHTYDSLRPELDELVAKLVAQGMETREGGDGTAPSRSDDSPVRKDAP